MERDPSASGREFLAGFQQSLERANAGSADLLARMRTEVFEGDCVEGVTARVTYQGEVRGIEISDAAFRTIDSDSLGDVVARAVMSAMGAPNRWLISQFAQCDTEEFPLSRLGAAALSGDEAETVSVADQIARRGAC